MQRINVAILQEVLVKLLTLQNQVWCRSKELPEVGQAIDPCCMLNDN